MSDPADVVSVERLIPAASEKIFDLLADPARHSDIDGSGTVRDPTERSGRLSLGDSFTMSMKMGIPYSMTSTVIEFEENRRIAWQTRGVGKLGSRMGGRIWRYDLEPVEGGTRVRESWDLSQEKGPGLTKRFGAARTSKNMEATLARIEQLVAG